MTKVLYFIDDGNRLEKAQLIDHLKNNVDLTIVTHDQRTYERYHKILKTFLIKPKQKRRIFRGLLKCLLVKPLNTNNRLYRNKRQFYNTNLIMKIMLFIKKYYQKMIFFNCSVAQIYKWVYPFTYKEYDFLNNYSYFLYSPISIKSYFIVHEARRRKLKIINWIYSWDNPMKDNESIKGADYYFVWNKENKNDLKKYHMISESKIHIVGPLQFDYLIENKSRDIDEYKKQKYVLYVCAHGIREHVEQEVINILGIKNMLNTIDSSVELIVRPYPFIIDMNWYTNLVESGIKLDPIPSKWDPYKLTEDDLVKKKNQLSHALCVINFSSTIVLEASFTKTPIIQIKFSFDNNWPDTLHINQTLKNPHLKHLLLDDYPNICNSKESMRIALSDILQGHSKKYMDYSNKLQEFAHPISECKGYKQIFEQTLQKICSEKME